MYCTGFKANLDEDPVTYYIDDNYDSDKVILDLVDELLRPKYSKVTFFCHNLGGFDVVFIVKTINNYNENFDDKYSIKFIFRDDSILKITISKKIGDK